MEAKADQKELMQEPLQHRTSSPGLGPWLVYFHGSRGRSQTFFSMSEGTCEVKKILEMRRKLMCTCSHGWLVLVDDDLHLDCCFLFNPVTVQKIQLPDYDVNFRYYYCVLSLPPNDPKAVVMFFDILPGIVRFMFCKPGDLEWTKQELELHHEEYAYDSVRTVGAYKGEIYMLTYCEKLMLVNVENDSSITLKDLDVGDFDRSILGISQHYNVFLVELCGGLFRVDRHSMDKNNMEIRIEVRKLDFKKKVWRKVTKMNDHALFTGSSGQALSCSTKEYGISGNTVYFTLWKDRSLYEYDLETQSVAVSLPCPNVKHEECEPYWILTLV